MKEGQPCTLPRARLSLPITLHLDEWETDTHTLELSEAGCSFSISRSPSVEHFAVALELRRHAVLRCTARVVAVVPYADGHYVCVAFTDLSPAQRAALANAVSQGSLIAQAV